MSTGPRSSFGTTSEFRRAVIHLFGVDMPTRGSAATCLRDRPLFNAFSTAPCQYSSRRISPIVSLRCCSKCYQRSGIKPRQVQTTRLGATHLSEKRSDRRLRAQKCVFCASDGCLLSHRRLSANIFGRRLLSSHGNSMPLIMKKNNAARIAAMGTVMIQAAAMRSRRLRFTNSTRCTRPRPRRSCFPSRRSAAA